MNYKTLKFSTNISFFLLTVLLVSASGGFLIYPLSLFIAFLNFVVIGILTLLQFMEVRKQGKLANRQAFENTFYKMLDVFNDIRKNLRAKGDGEDLYEGDQCFYLAFKLFQKEYNIAYQLGGRHSPSLNETYLSFRTECVKKIYFSFTTLNHSKIQ